MMRYFVSNGVPINICRKHEMKISQIVKTPEEPINMFRIKSLSTISRRGSANKLERYNSKPL